MKVDEQKKEQKFEYREFNRIDEIKLPFLVLAVKYSSELVERGEKFSYIMSNIHRYNFKEDREGLDIVHQTVGHSHNNYYMNGTILKPKAETHEGIKQINNYWYNSQCVMWGVSLEEILKYREQLKNLLDVDCNLSYRDFEEGIYPIDCNVENIRKLALDEIPDKLDDLIKFENEFSRLAGCIDR